LSGPSAKPNQDVQPKLRLDKWLCSARFFKTREVAAKVITSGRLRLNGQSCRKPGHSVTAGDTLTFPQAQTIRLIRVLALSDRRGPASEAQLLYHDLALDPSPPLE
jgi:ribosome-associated heat shock protein Hsp15